MGKSSDPSIATVGQSASQSASLQASLGHSKQTLTVIAQHVPSRNVQVIQQLVRLAVDGKHGKTATARPANQRHGAACRVSHLGTLAHSKAVDSNSAAQHGFWPCRTLSRWPLYRRNTVGQGTTRDKSMMQRHDTGTRVWRRTLPTAEKGMRRAS
ncbi:hypothetical protein BC831DRAFT_476097, partial [Entophlyctis helioformis]